MPSQPVVYCLLPRTGIMFMSAVIGCWELIRSFAFFFVFRDTFKRKTFIYMISYLGRFITLLSAIGFLYSCYIAYKRRFKSYNRLLYLFMVNLAFDAFNVIWYINTAFTNNINRDRLRDKLSNGIMSERGTTYHTGHNNTLFNSTLSTVLDGRLLNGTLPDGTTYNGTMRNETFFSGTMSNGTLFNMTVDGFRITRTGNGTITQGAADITANMIATGVSMVIPLIVCIFFILPFLNKLYFVSRIHAYVKYVLYKKEESQPPEIQVPHKLPECSQ